jgi:hypothetical protein
MLLPRNRADSAMSVSRRFSAFGWTRAFARITHGLRHTPGVTASDNGSVSGAAGSCTCRLTAMTAITT